MGDRSPGLFVSHGRDVGKTLGRGTLWSVVKKAAKELGLFKGTSPHAFRHFRAQQLLHEGMDLDVLQAYLGHADISTTRRIYAPYTAVEKVRDQLETFGRTAKDAAQDDTGTDEVTREGGAERQAMERRSTPVTPHCTQRVHVCPNAFIGHPEY